MTIARMGASVLRTHTAHVRRKPWLPAILLILLALVLLISKAPHQNPIIETLSDRLRPVRKPGWESTSNVHRLLLPATSSNAELCKTILSAKVLGYNTPTLVNWGVVYDKPLMHGGSHLGKIDGVLAYLETLRLENNNEIVILLDAYDSWLQLRPEVLMSRYHEINRGLYARAVKELGSTTINQVGVTQSIIFSAQKACGPFDLWNDVACYAQPESPLRKDLYGNDTDILDPELHLPMHFRPHWLNSGIVIGPVMDMRKMMRRATEKLETSNHQGSDQYIFNEIFGTQQYHRELMRLKNRGLVRRFTDSLQKLLGSYTPSIADPHPTHVPPVLIPGQRVEYGIGIDYEISISHSAVMAEWDGAWFTYSDKVDLRERQLELGVDPPRLTRLPEDVWNSKSPFAALEGTGITGYVDSWLNVPLYSNIYTGTVPAIVHMNGFKMMRQAVWDRMWFHRFARDLLIEAAKLDNVGAWSDKGDWLSWDTLCGEHEQEVFRDLLRTDAAAAANAFPGVFANAPP